MAEHTIETRILLRYDTLSNWENSTVILKQGEAAIAVSTFDYTIEGTNHRPNHTPPAVGIKVEFQVVLPGKLPHFPVIGCALNVRAGSVMVKDEGAAGVVPHLFAAHLIERINRLQIQIVDFGKVYPGGYDLPGVHRCASAVPGQNLFDGVHKPSSLLSVRKRILNIVYDIQSEIIISPQPGKCKPFLRFGLFPRFAFPIDF